MPSYGSLPSDWNVRNLFLFGGGVILLLQSTPINMHSTRAQGHPALYLDSIFFSDSRTFWPAVPSPPRDVQPVSSLPSLGSPSTAMPHMNTQSWLCTLWSPHSTIKKAAVWVIFSWIVLCLDWPLCLHWGRENPLLSQPSWVRDASLTPHSILEQEREWQSATTTPPRHYIQTTNLYTLQLLPSVCHLQILLHMPSIYELVTSSPMFLEGWLTTFLFALLAPLPPPVILDNFKILVKNLSAILASITWNL